MACKIHSNKTSHWSSVKLSKDEFMLPSLPCTWIRFDVSELREIQGELRTVDLSKERRLILDAMVSFFIKTQNATGQPTSE